jgi:DNA-binding HxlR family transcriptional regulator
MEPACGPGPRCPVTRAVEVLGGKWKLHIVFHLMDGTKRFSELGRAIPGITQQSSPPSFGNWSVTGW